MSQQLQAALAGAPIAQHRVARRRKVRGSCASLGSLLVLLSLPVNAAQTEKQQACINRMNRAGARLATVQNRENRRCLRLAAAGRTHSARACLRKDARGRVQRAIARLRRQERAVCLAHPGQLPDFAYAGSRAVVAGALGETIGMVGSLFGKDLDAASVNLERDEDGALCQLEVLGTTSRLFSTLWKTALVAKRNGLNGVLRRTGADPNTPVESGAELLSEILASVPQTRFTPQAAAIALDAARASSPCQRASTPIAELFPGECRGAGSSGALLRCARSVARRHFFASLARFDDLDVGCDLLDNGLFDLSCVSEELVEHVLERTGYGRNDDASRRIEELGLRRYLEEQLHPETLPDDELEALLLGFPSLEMSFLELRENYPRNPPPGQPRIGEVLLELQAAKVLRAVASRRQLSQVLTDFWFNHFNVMVTGARRRWDISPYERDTIRPHVLGRFEDLLLASARSPAMGDYLDNRRNRVNAINENYARELMELHTLGVDGGFDEEDVVEVARSFTGWRENYANEDGFEFRASWHDQGSKQIMDTLILPPGGGYEDGVQVIQFLSSHASTARFISRKLVQRFVAEAPPYALVERAANTFLRTRGDLRAVMRAILFSPEFLLYPHHREAKVKRPLVLAASLARALGADPARLQPGVMARRTRDLGENLFGASPPTGYPDVSGFWTSPGSVLLRFNQIERSARHRDGFSFDLGVAAGSSEETVDALIAGLLPAGVSDETRGLAIAFLDLLEGQPDARRIEQASAFLLSAPEFLMH